VAQHFVEVVGEVELGGGLADVVELLTKADFPERVHGLLLVDGLDVQRSAQVGFDDSHHLRVLLPEDLHELNVVGFGEQFHCCFALVHPNVPVLEEDAVPEDFLELGPVIFPPHEFVGVVVDVFDVFGVRAHVEEGGHSEHACHAQGGGGALLLPRPLQQPQQVVAPPHQHH